ncbi:hypothetical protein GCM10022239_03860 [Leifsonia bigeumensis]|uniref:DUF7448 domain-containing protein n=1 Tax=Leifsonella bigeumensis TaxID=433643 RepID=A0ABP7F2Z8_9MICO
MNSEVAKRDALTPTIVTQRYAPEALDNHDDDGTMPENVAALAEHVIGHRIVTAEKGAVPSRWYGDQQALIITLDNGKRVTLANSSDCCAYTDLESFLLHADQIHHVITGVGTTDGFTTWHVYADFGDILELKVGWSCGNPFYYGYGFDIAVLDAAAAS